jgi:uncharacterized phage protein (TIGR01671 family)
MREIKFRGWDDTKKEYHKNPVAMSNDGMLKIIYGEKMEHWKDTSFVPEQCTGVKDRHVVESYENDVCEYVYWIQTSQDPDSTGRKFDGVGIIVFVDGCFMIQDIKNTQTIPLHYTDLSFVIIGNINENPELLK